MKLRELQSLGIGTFTPRYRGYTGWRRVAAGSFAYGLAVGGLCGLALLVLWEIAR